MAVHGLVCRWRPGCTCGGKGVCVVGGGWSVGTPVPCSVETKVPWFVCAKLILKGGVAHAWSKAVLLTHAPTQCPTPML
eukprot:332223-Chlamydomonas_euryale.AAC.1